MNLNFFSLLGGVTGLGDFNTKITPRPTLKITSGSTRKEQVDIVRW